MTDKEIVESSGAAKVSELQKTSTLQARFAGTTHLRNCAKKH